MDKRKFITSYVKYEIECPSCEGTTVLYVHKRPGVSDIHYWIHDINEWQCDDGQVSPVSRPTETMGHKIDCGKLKDPEGREKYSFYCHGEDKYVDIKLESYCIEIEEEAWQT